MYLPTGPVAGEDQLAVLFLGLFQEARGQLGALLVKERFADLHAEARLEEGVAVEACPNPACEYEAVVVGAKNLLPGAVARALDPVQVFQ